MAGGVESLGAHAGFPRQLVQGVVPGQSVSPLVQERLDSLPLGHLVIQPDHEPVPPPDAFAQDVPR